MKKHLLLVCLLIAALLLPGCALIEKDAEVDAQTPIITVGDIVYNKLYVQWVEYNQLGAVLDPDGAYSFYVDIILNSLTQQALEEHMIQKLELDKLTDEELAQLNEGVAATQEDNRLLVQTYYFSDTELEGEELDTAINEMMEQLGYTDEAALAGLKSELFLERLNAYVTDEIVVTEEEARANFDTLVQSAIASYEENLSAFGTAYNSDETTFYTPAGYRHIKSLFVGFTDEDAAIISDIESQISTQTTFISATQTEIDGYAERDLTEEEQATLSELTMQLNEAQAELTQLADSFDKATEQAYANLAQTMTQLRDRLNAGEDFAALMAELGEDTTPVNLGAGYAVCADFSELDSALVNAAMALTAVGDVTSEDVRLEDGIAILLYSAEMPQGEVDFETVKDLDAVTQLEQKKSDAYSAQITIWLEENPVKVDREALK